MGCGSGAASSRPLCGSLCKPRPSPRQRSRSLPPPPLSQKQGQPLEGQGSGPLSWPACGICRRWSIPSSTKPESVTGTFEERTLTIWTDSELTQGFHQPGEDTPPCWNGQRRLTPAKSAWVVFKVGKPEPVASSAQTQEAGQPQPAEDKFNDLLALGRQFGNFTVK